MSLYVDPTEHCDGVQAEPARGGGPGGREGHSWLLEEGLVRELRVTPRRCSRGKGARSPTLPCAAEVIGLC